MSEASTTANIRLITMYTVPFANEGLWASFIISILNMNRRMKNLRRGEVLGELN